jgi:hypothetical protein
MDAMSRRPIPKLVVALVVAVVGGFFLGRGTAPSDSHQQGYDEGLSVGRALQAGDALPADTKDVATKAFEAGHRSGLEDSFAGYDGGWNLGQPYVVVIGKGTGGATYRIESRELLRRGVAYQLCKKATAVCSQ